MFESTGHYGKAKMTGLKDTMTILIMTLLVTTLLIMTMLTILNMVDTTCNSLYL
jgi:hypothetical protein